MFNFRKTSSKPITPVPPSAQAPVQTPAESRKPNSDHAADQPAELDPILYAGNPKLIRRFVMELTNHCNLRCRYCHQSKPEFQASDPLSDETFEEVLEYLSRHPVDVIDLTGGGDILMAPGWAKKCKRMLDLGIKLDTTINLGKILTDDEIEALARFNIVTVSIDSIDREILSSVRKSVDIRTIMYNIMRIRSARMRMFSNVHVMPPNEQWDLHWIISAVYSAEIVHRIDELASFAITMGAKTFQIQDLMVFNSIANNVTSVWELKGEEAVQAVDATIRALELASHRGLIIQIPPHFVDRLVRFKEKAVIESDQPILQKTGS